MKRIFAFLAISFGLIAGGVAQADSPSYDYVEIAWGDGDLDIDIEGFGSADIEQDGYELEFSTSLGDSQFLSGAYYDVDGDEAGVDVETDGFELAWGWLFETSDDTVVELSARWRDDEIKASDGVDSASDDVDGIGIGAGVRSNVSDNVELYGRIGWFASDYEGAVTVDFGAVFAVTDNFAISASYEDFDYDDDGVEVELDQFQIGARFNF